MAMNRAPGSPLRAGIRGVACCLTGLVWAAATGAEEPEGPPKPDAQEVHASFEAFVEDWVDQLAKDAEDERARNRRVRPTTALGNGLGYRTIDGEYKIRLRETGRPKAPYVGILTYVEHRYECKEDAVPEDCSQVDSAEITEIFPVKDGDWAY